MNDFYITTKVVGVTFNGRQRTLAKLKIGEILVLKREPDNSVDINAIKVFRKRGAEVGYIPREMTKWLAKPLEKAGGTMQVRAKDLTGGVPNYPTRGVEVEFMLHRRSE
jgi:hypothetical protein